MQFQDIRLRLVIRRHGVPEVKLVWPCSCSDDLTVARVLEQVNEVVTLENGEWGLEDYAVELADGRGGSFECLHFQQVGRILKDEDQVLIRSLLAGDLKRRQLSGRHQISEDGTHLVDGLPFGRPWLRTPTYRPQVELPPRKRARIVRCDEDEEEQDQQLLLEAPEPSRAEFPKRVCIREDFNDDDDEADEYAGDDLQRLWDTSDENSSFNGDPDLEDDLEEELQLLKQDSAAGLTDGDHEPQQLEDVEEHLRLVREDSAAETDDDDDFEGEQVQQEDEDEEDDEAEGDNENLEQEARLLQHENALLEQIEPLDEPSAPLRNTYPPIFDKVTSFPKIDDSYFDLLAALQDAFPAIPLVEVYMELVRTGKDLRQAYTSLADQFHPVLTFDETMDRAVTVFARSPPRLVSGHPFPSDFGGLSQPNIPAMEELAGVSKSRRPLIEEVDDVEESGANVVVECPYAGLGKIASTTSNAAADVKSDASSSASDSEDEPSSKDDESSSESDSNDSSSSSSEEESQAEEQITTTSHIVQDQPEASSSDTSLSDDSDSSDSDTSDDDDSSDSDSESNNNGNGVRVDGSSDSSDESGSVPSDLDSSGDSASDTSDDSDSEADETSSKLPVLSKMRQVPKQQDKLVLPSCALQPANKPQAAPGRGLTRTQKRNDRRRRNKLLKQPQPLESELKSEKEKDAAREELLARKQALLASILNEATENSAQEFTKPVQDKSMENDHQPEGPLTAEESQREPYEEPQNGFQEETPGSKDQTVKRRNRFDSGAGRRLLFGALGLKPPKTKADEEKLRQNLMKDVRPLNNPRVTQTDVYGSENKAPTADDDTGSWKDKIVYRAVECCHENIVLSEPPFPFVQRWDPQQKYESMRKRKRASETYHAEASFAGDEPYYLDDQAGVEREAGRKKKKTKKSNSAGTTTHLEVEKKADENDDILLNYDDTPVKSSQFADVDDLPSLPDDIGMLPMLEPGTAKPGMIITWKELLMSKATKWQPEIVSVTGLIIPGGKSTLHVVLAKRDREKNDKVYDEQTGQRLYGKFEAPDLDEADEGEDTGFRALEWSEMIEPRLLQHGPTTGVMGTTVEDTKPWEGEEAEVKVNHCPTPETCLVNHLSKDEPRAAIREDMMQHASNDTQEYPESVSVQSGQQMLKLDLSTSWDEVMASTASDSWEMLKQKKSCLSKTLEAEPEEAADGVASPEKLKSQDVGKPIQDGVETAADRGIEPGLFLADAPQSENLVPNPAHSPGDQGSTDGDFDVPVADETNMIVPSSQASIGSGHQPMANSYMEDSREDDGTVIPETLPLLCETRPTWKDEKQTGTPSNSSSPFPSIEEIFMTARQTQSPTKKSEISALSARKAKSTWDLEYEEAMRKLDEGHESEHSLSKNEEVGNMFPNATQPSVSTGFTSFVKITKKGNQRTHKSRFVVPAGSQVIALSSSSSSSPQAKEDDEMGGGNETAARKKKIVPTGSGWADNDNNGMREGLGQGVPPTTAVGTRRPKRGERTPSPVPLISAMSKYKGGRRKISWRK